MANLGLLSLWITPSAYALSLAHSITLLVLSAKERKKTSEARAGKFPATSSKATIICTWILAVGWAAAAGMGMAMRAIWTGDLNGSVRGIMPYFEFAFIIVEIGVLVVLVLKCTRERHLILGADNTMKWYNLGPYDVA
ncbi:hypothetical protein BDZ97DRAFT_534520 [Flammula alnicola]|nr:hypothetical protein BDZ97DRAFT_534520 [Flammula alnicola]